MKAITTGCSAERYCPNDPVTREQMATFLVRALDLPAATQDWFTDDETSIHEPTSTRIAEAGIASGCGGTNYCPKAVVTRDQMASFLARALTCRRGPRRLHRRRDEHPRAEHQPRRRADRDRLRRHHVLPDRGRDPRPDGRLPAPRPRLTSGASHGAE